MNPHTRIESLEDDLKKYGQVILKMQDNIDGLKAEVERYASEALLALAGAVPTPEKGYLQDGGPSQMGSDIRRLREDIERLRAMLDIAHVSYCAACCKSAHDGHCQQMRKLLENVN